MAALPVAMTLTSPNAGLAEKSITIPSNVLFATATISTYSNTNASFRINGSMFYFGSQIQVGAGGSYFTSPLQGIGLKGGDILTCSSDFSVNMIAYTS